MLSGFAMSQPASAAIALDIGHSVRKAGAISASGHSEFQFNLRLGQAVSRVLSQAQRPHMVIGEDGQADNLTRRTQLANQHGATLFASIHHDSIQPQFVPRAREFAGYSIFVSQRNPSFAQSLRCAQAVGYQLQKIGLRPSRYHAMDVPGERRAFLDEKLGVHRYDGLAVLHSSKAPALLIEAGVIVNPDEEARLKDQRQVQAMAVAIARGLIACSEKVSS